MEAAIIWIALIIIFAVVEIITVGLTSIWFAGGALVAFVTGILGFGTVVQVIVFIVVSLVLLIATRPIAVKFFNQERQKTNAESLIGQQALVLEDIDTSIKRTGRSQRAGMVGKDG